MGTKFGLLEPSSGPTGVWRHALEDLDRVGVGARCRGRRGSLSPDHRSARWVREGRAPPRSGRRFRRHHYSKFDTQTKIIVYLLESHQFGKGGCLIQRLTIGLWWMLTKIRTRSRSPMVSVPIAGVSMLKQCVKTA